MKRTELIDRVVKSGSGPYDKTDLIDRIATKRIISAGQSRFLAALVDDTAVSVDTTNPSEDYVIVMYDASGTMSHEEMCRSIQPRVHHNAAWADGMNCAFVTYED